MSHIVSIDTEIRDAAAVRAACERLGLPQPVSGTTRLFSDEAAGLAVQLPGWKYPIVCNLESGQVKFDTFGGLWGDKQELDRFLHAYAIEKTRIEALRKGHTTSEQPLGSGWTKVTVHSAGHSDKKVEVTVSPTGQTRVETKGYAGPDCRLASEFIEKALGKRTGEQLTAEFHQQATNQQPLQQKT